MSRIDVFYGRTDGTPGYKVYSCVVVRTTETEQLRYETSERPDKHGRASQINCNNENDDF